MLISIMILEKGCSISQNLIMGSPFKFLYRYLRAKGSAVHILRNVALDVRILLYCVATMGMRIINCGSQLSQSELHPYICTEPMLARGCSQPMALLGTL